MNNLNLISILPEAEISKEWRILVENMFYYSHLIKINDKSELINKEKERTITIIKKNYKNLSDNKEIIILEYLLSTFQNSNEKLVLDKLLFSLKNKEGHKDFMNKEFNFNVDEDNYRFYDFYINLIRLTEGDKYKGYNPYGFDKRDITGKIYNNGDIYVTYDDGASEVTPKILDMLKSKNIKASFFVLGKTVADNIEVLNRIIKDGHCLGAHSYNHKNFTLLSDVEMDYELKSVKTVMEKRLNYSPKLFRVPYGERTESVLKNIYKDYDYNVIWNIDSNDWRKEYSADFITELTIKLSHLNNGGIILFHDIYLRTLKISEVVINRLDRCGFNFLELSGQEIFSC